MKNSKRVLLVSMGLLVVAALLLCWPWSDGPADAPPVDRGAAGRTGAAAIAEAGAAAAEATEVEEDAPVAGAVRQPVAPVTTLRGTFGAPLGPWPGGGEAELHLSEGMPEGGMLAMFSELSQTARRTAGRPDAQARQDAESRLKRVLGVTEAVRQVPVDATGSFHFDDPPAGRYAVRLRHSRLHEARRVEFVLALGEQRDLGVLPTELAGSLLVLVSNGAGQPVVDSRLELSRELDYSAFSDPSALANMLDLIRQMAPREARTDARGAAVFHGLTGAAPWLLHVRGRDLAEELRPVHVLAGHENVVRVELSAGARIEALAFDPEGQLVPGAQFQLSPRALQQERDPAGGGAVARLARGEVKRLTAGDDGVATASALPAGLARIEAVTPGYLRQDREVVLARDATERVEFRLDRGLAVAGIVLDEDGEPLPDARVMHMALLGESILGMDVSGMIGLDLLTLDLERRGMQVRPDGTFLLGGFRAGEQAQLLAAASGCDPQVIQDIVPGGDDVEFRLLRCAGLSGRVVAEPGGEPVGDFTVRLEQRVFMMIDRPVVLENFTGRSDGSFQVEGAPRASLQVVISAEGRAAHSQRVDLSDGAVDLGEIALKLPGVIEGITRDSLGAPLPGVAVRVARGGVMDASFLSQMFGGQSQKSDADGRFRIENLTGRRVRLLAEKEGYAPIKSGAIRVQSGVTTSDVELRLGAGGAVHGRVVDLSGRPQAAWRVQAAATNGMSLRFTHTDAVGAFSFEGLAPGTHKVDAFPEALMAETTAWNADYDPVDGKLDLGGMVRRLMERTVSQRVVVRDGERLDIEMVFEDPDAERTDLVQVHGSVRVGSEPVVDGMVLLFRGSAPTPSYMGDVVGGIFQVEHVQPGRYRVQVQTGLSGALTARPLFVEVPARPRFDLDLDLPGGELAGHARYPDGTAAAGVLLSLTTAEDSGAVFERMPFGEGAVMTDERGAFRFAGLGPGRYEIFAREAMGATDAGRSGRVTDLELAGNERRSDLELTIAPGGELVVHVRSGAVPRGNALVTLLRTDGKPVDVFPRALTDAEGRAVLHGLPTGPYRVVVDAPRVAPAVSEVLWIRSGEEHRLDLSLPAGVPVTAAWTGELSPGLAGQLVLYSIWQEDGALQRSGRLLIPAAGNPVELGPLLPGRYRIRLEGPRVPVLETAVEVRAPGPAQWTFDLEKLERGQ